MNMNHDHDLHSLVLGGLPEYVVWICTCGKKGKATAKANDTAPLDDRAYDLHKAHARRAKAGVR